MIFRQAANLTLHGYYMAVNHESDQAEPGDSPRSMYSYIDYTSNSAVRKSPTENRMCSKHKAF